MELPSRRMPRHPKYNYNTPGYYFITICTQDKKCILGTIVGSGLPDAPKPQLTSIGQTVRMQLEEMAHFYPDIVLEKYVVMPNHIHLLVQIPGAFPDKQETDSRENARIPQFVGTFKRMTGRKLGRNIWQTSYHDHIIRGDADYLKIWNYIDTNPARWERDCFYG